MTRAVGPKFLQLLRRPSTPAMHHLQQPRYQLSKRIHKEAYQFHLCSIPAHIQDPPWPYILQFALEQVLRTMPHPRNHLSYIEPIHAVLNQVNVLARLLDIQVLANLNSVDSSNQIRQYLPPTTEHILRSRFVYSSCTSSPPRIANKAQTFPNIRPHAVYVNHGPKVLHRTEWLGPGHKN